MHLSLVCFFAVWVFPMLMFGQSNVRGCDKIRSGTFYFYPKSNQKGFVIIREKGVQSEINLTTSDTSFWQISWKNRCEFNLTYIRKSVPISTEEENFYKAHTIAVRVLKVTKDYYAFKAGLDSITNSNTTDTLWFKAGIN